MGRRTLLLNVALLAAVAMLASYLVSSWQQFERENRLDKLVVVRPPANPSSDLGGREARSPLGDFEVIGQKPLFRPDRMPVDAGPEGGDPVEAPEPPNAEMTGSSLFGGVARATLKLAPARRNGAVQTLTVSTGDAPPQLNGYRVAEVTSTSVTLQWNDRQHFLELTASAPQKPTQAVTSGPTIINVGRAAPAVEATTAAAAQAEQRGLKVAVVANQNQQNARGAGARNSRGGLNQGRGGAGTSRAGTQTTPTRRPGSQNNRPPN